MSETNEYEMSIYIIYDNFDSLIENINQSFKCTNINKECNITYFWKWIPIIPMTNSLNSSLNYILEFLKKKIEICFDKNNNHQFKEVLIIQNNNISFNEFFENLNNILDENGEYYHPFIIFLTKEDIDIDYDECYNLDKKKIFFLPPPEDEASLSEFIFKLIQCCSYYNELGDYFEINGYPYQVINDNINYPTFLNILVLGRSQSGKSTFINLLLNEKRAKEGGNNCGCSQKDNIYKLLNYPIRIYDTVGFGDEDKNVEDIKKFFKKIR